MDTAHKLKMLYHPRKTAAHLVTTDEVISFLQNVLHNIYTQIV